MGRLIGMAMTLLALLSAGMPSGAAESSRGRRTTIYVDGGRRLYYRNDGGSVEYRRMPSDRWSVRAGVGISSDVNLANFLYGRWCDVADLDLSGYYGDWHGPTKSSGAYSLGVEYLFARWFALSFDVGVETLWHDIYDGTSGMKAGRASGTALILMPQAKFVYLNRPSVRLYGYLGAGIVTYFGFGEQDTSSPCPCGPETYYDGSPSLEAAAQIVPIGVEAGRRFFGFAEVGAGYLFTGLRAGLGYRF